MEILGVQYSLGKLSIPKARVQGYMDYKTPSSFKQVKQFLGSVSFYRYFIDNFSQHIYPLLELSNKANVKEGSKTKEKFTWKEEHQQSFENIKKLILNHTETHLPDFNKPFFAKTDSSKNAIGGLLYQKSSKNDIEPIAAVSRVLSKTEQNYTTYRKEIIAILYLLSSMDIFLRFSHVHIETDCKSILFLKAAKNSADVLTRYAIQLASYNITMEHIPGKENTISDALSRSRDIQEDEPEVPYMNEKEANILIKALKMPTSTKFTMKDMKQLLEGTGLPSLIKTHASYIKRKRPQTIPLNSLQPTKKTIRKICTHKRNISPALLMM